MRARPWNEANVIRDREGKFAEKPGGGNLSAISGALRDAAQPTADVPDSPSRHGTGRGMPSIVAGADVRTRKGDEIALDTHANGEVTLTLNGVSVTNDRGTASSIISKMPIAASYEDDGPEFWIRSPVTGPDGNLQTNLDALVRPEGNGAVSVRLASAPGMSADAIRNSPGVTLSRRDVDNLQGAFDRGRAATRLDTGPGELDMYLTDDKRFGFRHVGNDGSPVEVEFNARSMARIRRAMNVVYEGFDEDDPDGPDEGVTEVDVDTNAGKVRVQLDGEWRGDGPGDRLWILPVDHDEWGIVVSGDRQDAFGDVLEELELLAEGEGWYDSTRR